MSKVALLTVPLGKIYLHVAAVDRHFPAVFNAKEDGLWEDKGQ